MSALSDQLAGIAQAPVLLVACDYDGTVAPIVSDPRAARPDRRALVALKSLAALPQTHVAVVSGRALGDLARHTEDAQDLHLVGSHGSEFEPGFSSRLSTEALTLLRRLAAELHGIAQGDPGFYVEEKPASLALHYRNAGDEAARRAVQEILSCPATLPGVHVRHGKMVIELSVVETNKGMALQRLRHRLGASAVIYLGDDATDEDAFATLSGPDISVKVGPGSTAARFRVSDTTEATRVLAELAERRADWLVGAQAVPIEQHSLLSDQRTLALVSPDGRIVWMCAPRLDSSAIFAELLGGPTAGFFAVRAVGEDRPLRQYYDGDTFILKTEWSGLTITDYLDCSGGRAFQRAGRSDLVRVLEGKGRARIQFAPRLDFGRVATQVRICDDGLEVEGGRDLIALYAPGVSWLVTQQGDHQMAVADVEINGGSLAIELRYGTASLAPAVLPEAARREQTRNHWNGWARTLSLPNVERNLVLRSALVLKALTYGPSGAIAAAATTSLPESVGGVRNWDYRFCWPRDAALAAAALLRLGNTGTAMKFLDWVLGVLDQCASPDQLSPVYTVTGRHLGSEAELNALAGYAGSRPVRVGNAAAQQMQLDVFGQIADLVALLAQRGCPLSSDHWRLIQLMVEAVEKRWRDADHGIWEPRIPPKHHLHSKVMCWQTVDRALSVARYLGRARPEWSELKGVIAEDLIQHAWRPDEQAFGASYDSSDADAAALSVGLSGLVPSDDTRFIGTVNLVERTLRDGPTVYRYRYDDGLPGSEGGFHLCTTWLIEAYALTGRIAEAEDLFHQYAALAGPTGLFSEEYDPRRRRALGNHPQAYSHLGLINAALRLNR